MTAVMSHSRLPATLRALTKPARRIGLACGAVGGGAGGGIAAPGVCGSGWVGTGRLGAGARFGRAGRGVGTTRGAGTGVGAVLS
jgi:hypothetical protein